MKQRSRKRRLPKYALGGSPQQQSVGNQFNSAMRNAGIWGAAFKATQGVASLAEEGIGGDAGLS